MIFYRFLLNTQALGYLFVLEMLFAAHAINHLALLRHAFYHHVDEQLGILATTSSCGEDSLAYLSGRLSISIGMMCLEEI